MVMRPHPLMCTCSTGFGQGVRRSMTAMAGVLGPLWAGSAFELQKQYGYYPYFGVSLVLLLIATVSVTINSMQTINSINSIDEHR